MVCPQLCTDLPHVDKRLFGYERIVKGQRQHSQVITVYKDVQSIGTVFPAAICQQQIIVRFLTMLLNKIEKLLFVLLLKFLIGLVSAIILTLVENSLFVEGNAGKC